MEKVLVGVIGTGHLGRYHALNYAQIPEAGLVGVYDVRAERAERVAGEARCRAFTDPEALLDEVHAVSVAVPTDKHEEVVSAVLEKKIHCLVEKPIASKLEQADDLVGQAEKSGLVLQVGHVERFNPAVRVLRNFRIHPKFIEAHRLAPFNPRGTEVAVVLDLMIHDIDIVLKFIQSPIKRIDASGVAVVSDSIDIANARLMFQDGGVANLTASRISQKKMRKMRLFQKDTYISIDFDGKMSEIYTLDDTSSESDMILGEIGTGERRRRILYKRPEAEDENALCIELKEFIKAVRGEPNEGVSGREGRQALAVALDILSRLEE